MFSKSYDIRTSGRDGMHEITSQVADAIKAAGVKEGLVQVYVPHTTAGVTINENADPSVVHDMLEALDKAVPWRQPFYEHGEGNSAAHVKSSMVGCSLSVPIVDGRMSFGTWQGIYFCEFDGPRSRHYRVSVLGA